MSRLNQTLAVFCGFRVYAIWNREWSVFVTVVVLYLGHTALFLARVFLPLLSAHPNFRQDPKRAVTISDC